MDRLSYTSGILEKFLQWRLLPIGRMEPLPAAYPSTLTKDMSRVIDLQSHMDMG